MVERASKEALDLVEHYSQCQEEIESIRLYLSESPIGDEYGYLSESDWIIGSKFVDWLSDKGIKAFEEKGTTNV